MRWSLLKTSRKQEKMSSLHVNAMFLLVFSSLVNSNINFSSRNKVTGWVQVVLLTAEGTDSNDNTDSIELNKAITSCQRLVNKEWRMRQSVEGHDESQINNGVTFQINFGKVALSTDKLFDQEKLMQQSELLKAAFIIETYSVDPLSCVLSDLLGIPQISLTDEHNPSCKNVLSMRPDIGQLSESTMALIRSSQSRIVAVIIEDSMGETAIKFMSQGQLSQRFPFQVVGKVDFKKRETLIKAVKKLKKSGIKRVLMMMHSRHVEVVLTEVRNQGLELDDYKWFLPLMEFPVGLVNFSRLFGISGMRIPSKGAKITDNGECKYPVLYDAFNLVLDAAQEFKDMEKFLSIKAKQDSIGKYLCPTQESHAYGMELLKIAKKINFRGQTGDIRFMRNGYRDVPYLEASEIKEGGRIEKLGIWSSQCKKMIAESEIGNDGQLSEKTCKSSNFMLGTQNDFRPRNRHLKVVTSNGPPFIFYDPAKRNLGNEAFQGFCKDIIEKLAKDLNFTYDMYIVTPGSYSDKMSNGTSNGMIRDLIRKDADIALGSLTITAEREKVIDFTKPFMDFTMSLIMQKPPEPKVNFFTFLLPFKPELWISVVIMIIVSGLLLYVIDRYSPDGFRLKAMNKGEGTGEELSLANCIWFMTASFLQQGPDYTPRGAGGRVLSASFWFFCIIIVSTYTANLAAFFTKKSMETSIKSLDDLAKQDSIAYGVLEGGQTQSFFKNSKIPLYRKMYGQMQTRKSFSTSTANAIVKVRQGGYAYLTEHPMLSYYNQQKPCNTVLLQNLLEAKSYGLGLRIDSEWTNPLSVHILNLREKGVIEQMRRKWWNSKSACTNEEDKTVKKKTSLDFMSLAGVYIILTCGAVVSLCLLFIEVKYPNVCRRFEGSLRERFTGKESTKFAPHNSSSNGNNQKYLDTVDSHLVKPGPYPMEDDYNSAVGKDYDYATKKYFDSLRANKHYSRE